MKKVIVTGGRNYSDESTVRATLNLLSPCLIIQGGARGADQLAKEWAVDNGMPWVTYEADWTKYGKMAGRIRNREMLFAHRDALVVAFPGNSGTEHCVATAKIFKHTVLRIK